MNLFHPSFCNILRGHNSSCKTGIHYKSTQPSAISQTNPLVFSLGRPAKIWNIIPYYTKLIPVANFTYQTCISSNTELQLLILLPFMLLHCILKCVFLFELFIMLYYNAGLCCVHWFACRTELEEQHWVTRVSCYVFWPTAAFTVCL